MQWAFYWNQYMNQVQGYTETANTVHQLNDKEFTYLLSTTGGGRARKSQMEKLMNQRLFEQTLLGKGWLFSEDYQFNGKLGKAKVICPLGVPFDLVPRRFMESTFKGIPKGYWEDQERCHTIALQYTKRVDFQRLQSSAYKAAMLRDWLDDICSHMEEPANIAERYIYVIRNDRLKMVYIGLTHKPSDRFSKHKGINNNTGSKHIVHEHDTVFEAVTGALEMNHAAKEEAVITAQWKATDYKVLNSDSHLGNLGGGSAKWNRTNLKKEAAKYRSRKEFEDNSSGAYQAATKRFGEEFTNSICAHMINPRYVKKYHTPEGVFNSLKEAAKGNDIGSSTVNRRCNNPDKLIRNNLINPEYNGFTWRELGWWFEPIT